MMNEQSLYQNMFSAKNPPPMCVPVPYTPASMCFKLFDVFTPGRNLHMCMDVETKIRDKPYLVSLNKIYLLFKIILCQNKNEFFLSNSNRFYTLIVCVWVKMVLNIH